MPVTKPSVDEILAPKPVARPRIYAYAIADAAHHGLLKVVEGKLRKFYKRAHESHYVDDYLMSRIFD